jgi:hypothetical protein
MCVDADYLAAQVKAGRGHLYKVQPLREYESLFDLLYEEYLVRAELCTGMSVHAARVFCCDASEKFRKIPLKKQYENLATFKLHYCLSIRRITGTAQLLPENARLLTVAYFEMLRRAFDFWRPSGIWVLDETSVLWYPSVTKTLAKRGAKTVKAVTPNEKLASTALLVGRVHMTWKKVKGSWIPNIVHASNDPPFLIFKGVTGATIDSGLDAAGEHATCTPSAWINAEVFKKWIKLPCKSKG